MRFLDNTPPRFTKIYIWVSSYISYTVIFSNKDNVSLYDLYFSRFVRISFSILLPQLVSRCIVNQCIKLGHTRVGNELLTSLLLRTKQNNTVNISDNNYNKSHNTSNTIAWIPKKAFSFIADGHILANKPPLLYLYNFQ